MNNIIVSIDGPAGSGKERISIYIARKYKLFHLDSGILYRRLALEALKKKINFKDDLKLDKFIKSIDILSARPHKILRTENISKIASKIAIYPSVRRFVNFQQKKIVNLNLKKYRGCVIDGRDIGSNVFKNAKIKLFIVVKSKIRAKRRHKQLIELGEKSIYGEILKEINLRDKADKNRKIAPLLKPKKAIIIDNSESFRKTINQITIALKNI